MKIPLKYKVPLQGEYYAGISHCPSCGWKRNEDSLDWFIGFTDDYIICECQECFTKWYYHNIGLSGVDRTKGILLRKKSE